MDLSAELDAFTESALRITARHALPGGGFARFTRPDALGGERDAGNNAYGCADAVNLLYTLGELGEPQRYEASLQALQDDDGLFREATHHPIHTTAHCAAALELIDAQPRRPLEALADLRSEAAVSSFLDGLDWRAEPWTEAHRGAGLYAALLLCGELEPGWADAYFAWLRGNFDEATGLLRAGRLPERSSWKPALFPHLAGTFHYLFNMEYAGVAHPCPDALVDTCLVIFADELWPLATYVGFAEVDQVYCLRRASLRTEHRRDEAHAALAAFAKQYLGYLLSLDPDGDAGLDDLHDLFGAVCALAELQLALPDELARGRPLRQVLDRRPFI